jgi:hypothetical protein
VSKYYLDQRLLKHMVHSQLPTQQYFESPKLNNSIEIGDYIEVLKGEHVGKCGVINWFPKGDTKLSFHDIFTVDNNESSSGLLSISVPIAIVQWMSTTQTIQYTKERGYDVKPGDVMTVVRRPEYEAKGVVQGVDFPNAHLTLLCDIDHTLVSTIHLDSGISDI